MDNDVEKNTQWLDEYSFALNHFGESNEHSLRKENMVHNAEHTFVGRRFGY